MLRSIFLACTRNIRIQHGPRQGGFQHHGLFRILLFMSFFEPLKCPIFPVSLPKAAWDTGGPIG